MFTGIIRDFGTVVRTERTQGLVRLTIQALKTASRMQPLESVSVNGVCLSVVRVHQGALVFEVIPQTQRLTTLGTLRTGHRVNVEPSLSIVDRLSGHILLGHVDGTGTVVKRRQPGGELVLEIRLPRPLRRFLVPNGPIAVDGVSLTVGPVVTDSTFAVHLIPETLRQTTLSTLTVGDRVNLELDYLAKLIRQFTRSRRG